MRADPFIVKGEGLWAEHHCVAPLEQWSIGNETYAAALDDAGEALGRAYGDPTPVAFDLEWYATAAPTPLEPPGDRAGIEFGYEQRGVVHGAIECWAKPPIELTEVPAHRWHRWVTSGRRAAGLGPLVLPDGRGAHRRAGAVRVPRRKHQRPRAHPARLEPTSTAARHRDAGVGRDVPLRAGGT